MAMAAEPQVRLAPGAEENGLAVMLSDLLRQNLEAKPHKKRDFDALSGAVAIVADDAGVALTLVFRAGTLIVHPGIVGIPDVTVRADAESILALSTVPLTRFLGLPLPGFRDPEGKACLKSLFQAMRTDRLRVYGMGTNLLFLTRLTRVMSVNG